MARSRRSRRQTEAPIEAVAEPGLLDPVAVSRLETLPVRARIIVEGALSGLHRARQHGSSVEFAEHKEYSPGDEIRHIDWKVYGRADRYYVKQYEQESELACHLLLDASGSMAYAGATLSKLSYAAHLFSALAYLLIRQRDKVGLMVYGDEALDRFVPPRARPAHLQDLLSVLHDVIERGGRGEQTTAAALDRLGELSRHRRGLIAVATDLFDAGDQALTILRRLRARGHDVVLFQILHTDEIDLPFEGLTLFESLEGPRQLLADPGAVRREYKKRLTAFLERVRSECASAGVDHHLVPTSRALDQTLFDFVSGRSRRAARGR